MRSSSDWLLPPIVKLGSADRVFIDFDLLDNESEYLRYSLIHCDADWNPTDISEMEYIEGLNNQEVEDCKGSFNTYIPYYHYHLTLPNERINFLISGNYVVRFYSSTQPEKTLLTACFYVYEDEIKIFSELSGNTDISFQKGDQQLSLKIAYPDYFRISQEDLKVFVQQNSSPDKRRQVKGGMPIAPTQFSFEHNRSLIFEGGNEFRRFEILSHLQAGLNVDYISFDKDTYCAVLFPSESRLGRPYLYDRDQNGKYLIKCSNVSNAEWEADYFKVHFSLPTDMPFLQGKVYIYGELTEYKLSPSVEMVYNIETKAYEATLLLKQGAYNYTYVIVPNDSPERLSSLIEGSHWETENEYFTSVYYHPITERYDRLLGIDVLRKE